MPTHSDKELNKSFDWDLLVSSRLNAILCGNQAALDATLASLRDHLELPLQEWSFSSGSPLRSMNVGTLITRDIDATTLDEQRMFLEWLEGHRAVRVITVSGTPLYDLVRSGSMIETLYYRLNPIYCALDPTCTSGSVDSSSAA